MNITKQIASGQPTLAKMDGGVIGVPVTINFTLSVRGDFSWVVVRNGITFQSNSPLLTKMPQLMLSVQHVIQVTEFLNSLVPCCGNNDKKFIPLVESRKGSFLNASGKSGIYVCICNIVKHFYCTHSLLKTVCLVGTEVIAHYDNGGVTIRHTNCQLFVVAGKRCESCKAYRKTLFSLLTRHQRRQSKKR